MKKKTLAKAATSIMLIPLLGLVGCTPNSSGSSEPADSHALQTPETVSTAANEPIGVYHSHTKDGQAIDARTHFTAEDLTWDTASEVAIDLANPVTANGVSVEDGVLTITEAGNYRLSGQYSGQVKVAADKADAVRLILNGVNITNSAGPAISIESANRVTLYTSAGTTNTVADSAAYQQGASSKEDAAIYSKTNLTLAGEGTLQVTGNYKNGVHTTDGLVIANGTLEVNSLKTGLKGKDYVDIRGGTVTVTAQRDAIKATNRQDDGKGWLRLTGGAVTLTAGDDGLKAARTVEIAKGTLTVAQAQEGIEGQYINILGGTTTINSTNDGLNASLKDPLDDGAQSPSSDTQVPPAATGGGARDTTEVLDAAITMSGGTVTVNVSVEGDGVDSNGSQTYTGGTLIVNGPPPSIIYSNNSIDVNGDLLMNGTARVAAGGGDVEMFKAPAEASTNGYLNVMNLEGFTQENTLQVADSTGAVVANYQVVSPGVQLVFFSNPAIVKGQSYSVYMAPGRADVNTTALAAGAAPLGEYTAS